MLCYNQYTHGGYIEMEKTYEIKGMTCVICKANIEKALNSNPFIDSVRVNLIENEATIVFDETKKKNELNISNICL